MKTINVLQAEGPVLDWLVAKAEGEDYSPVVTYSGIGTECPATLYSTNWSQGGPIIEENGIGLLFDSGSICRKPSWFATPDDQSTTTSYEGEHFDPAFMVDEGYGTRGPTPLIAAMRCFVVAKLGEIVKVPEELA